MKALILDGKVVDVQETEFEVHSSMSWVDCDDNVAVGWTYDGKDFKTDVVELTSDEKLNKLRSTRNSMLAESDWLIVMHKELGTNTPAAWKTYRQELRDITKSATSLDDVTWPTKPS